MHETMLIIFTTQRENINDLNPVKISQPQWKTLPDEYHLKQGGRYNDDGH